MGPWKASLVRNLRRPVPIRNGYARHPVLKREFPKVEICPVPGEKEQRAMLALLRERKAMKTGVVIIPTLIAQSLLTRDSVAELR